MNKFVLGYVLGSIISSVLTEYLIKQEIALKIYSRGVRPWYMFQI